MKFGIIELIVVFVATAWIFFFLGKAYQVHLEHKRKFKDES